MPLALAPPDCIPCWPADRPLVALISADNSSASRFSIFAVPAARLSATASSSSLEPLTAADSLPFAPSADPITDLTRALAPPNNPAPQPLACPLWIGALHYELGALFESTALNLDPAAPLYTLYYCPAGLVHDNHADTWHTIGDPALIPELAPAPAPIQPITPLAPVTSNMGTAAYQRAVQRTIEYIRAGDIFQANISHKLSVQLGAPPRAVAHQLLRAAEPPFGAIIETPLQTILSLSPESLISLDARTRTITTRPIKGTRPHADPPQELLDSEKDAAELAMIVDLMRNDLGRVAEYGSVRVEHPRTLERHGGAAAPILHTSATIRATLRKDQSRMDLLRAIFPAGSITGAPKVRAMQIINELEPAPRGPYCGSIICADAAGNLQLSVSIRTATLKSTQNETTLDYHAGAGIVADSDPESEWRETLTKAALLRAVGADPETLS